MFRINNKIFALIICIYISLNVEAADSTRIAYGLNYVADFVGVRKTGDFRCFHLGLVQADVEFGTADIGLWQGGNFYFSGFLAYGGTPSASYIGDRHVVSNIEAGKYYGLYEAYYGQQLYQFNVKGGLLDLNSDFFSSSNALLFVNGSFGIGPNLSLNHSPAIYPVTGLGAVVEVDASSSLLIKVGVYDGIPEIASSGWHGFNGSLSREDGVLAIGEIHYSESAYAEKILDIKLGGCYQSTSGKEDLGFAEWSVYGVADYSMDVFESIDGYGSAFVQLGASFPQPNLLSRYFGGGMLWNNPLGDRLDGLTLGAAYASAIPVKGSGNGVESERVWELTALSPIGKFISLQADYQYVDNPGFGLLEHSHAHVGIVRILLDL